MRNAGGYAVMVDPLMGTKEWDCITCNHCQQVVFVDPKTPPHQQCHDRVIEADRCRMCMRHICPVCAGKGGCDPFEKKLDAIERADRLMRACGG